MHWKSDSSLESEFGAMVGGDRGRNWWLSIDIIRLQLLSESCSSELNFLANAVNTKSTNIVSAEGKRLAMNDGLVSKQTTH